MFVSKEYILFSYAENTILTLRDRDSLEKGVTCTHACISHACAQNSYEKLQ